jgi:hypothetical protein
MWTGRSQWPRDLRIGSAAAWLLGSRVRIPLGAWMFRVLCLYVVLSCVGRGLWDGLMIRPEESYRVSNSVWFRNLKGGGQGPIWAVEPMDGCMDDVFCVPPVLLPHRYGTLWLYDNIQCIQSFITLTNLAKNTHMQMNTVVSKYLSIGVEGVNEARNSELRKAWILSLYKFGPHATS